MVTGMGGCPLRKAALIKGEQSVASLFTHRSVPQPHSPGNPHPPSWILLKRGDETQGERRDSQTKTAGFFRCPAPPGEKEQEELMMKTLLFCGKAKGKGSERRVSS